MPLEEVKAQMHAAELAAGRATGDTTLIAVSKVQPLERVEAVLAAGHRIFGENRVQEADGKWPVLKDSYPDVELHLIGPLQTNKVKPAVALFDAIHAVDRLKLAQKIADAADAAGQCPDIYIQVNTGEEAQKAGVLPAEADGLIASVQALGLPLKGLMVIPPVDEEAALHFGLLAGIAERNGLTGLSMGMSGDFETAIRLGATHVRVGSAIFGERVKV